jgi:membrane protease subunit (stomatin/prohibitin family)
VDFPAAEEYNFTVKGEMIMANDLFGGLGGLMKGLSGFMPQDDPNVIMLNAQTEVSDLKNQEEAVYTEIGRLAYAQNPDAFPAQKTKLQLIGANLSAAEAKLNAKQQEMKAAEQAKREAEARSSCPSCGAANPDGVKFCQECGTKLGAAKAFCTSCGQENPPGTRFCGNCGNKLG